MRYTEKNHTFIICAYRENPYLEECITSVLGQSLLGQVKISTSTPNKHIRELAEKYNLSLVVNTGRGDAVDNLNFAYTQGETALVTLCHQDDYYTPLYLETVLAAANSSKKPLIIFTDYFEDRGGERVEVNKILTVKRMLNFPFRFGLLQGSRWVKRRVLSLGCPICCPAVTYNKEWMPGPPFREGFPGGSFDWDTWIRLAEVEGKFIYCRERAMGHRIWTGSGTTEAIKNRLRDEDEYKILCSLWPRPVAKLIFTIYHSSQSSNQGI